MSRKRMFESEEVPGIRGLTSLTEPDDGERVGAVVDVAVIGARGDGKTQFIVHAIRTLRAYAPPLAGAEHQYNRDVLQVVMNAREPRPDATVPGVVPHYVFRIRPEVLLAQIGAGGRLGLLARSARLAAYVAVVLCNAALLGGLLAWMDGGVTAAAAAAVGAVASIGCAVAYGLSRRQFVRSGEVEIVFWDVAGEHVYSSSAADYYSFLGALVRERRERSRARRGRSYAFAPVLMCNPVALGVHGEGSSYARLRQLMPLFASLDTEAPRALVAINRWSVVEKVCEAERDRDEVVALVPRPMADGDLSEISDGASAGAPTQALPLLRREVVRKHCLDAEDARDVDVRFSYLRYDAGTRCEFHEHAWQEFATLSEATRQRFRAPSALSAGTTPTAAIEYVYAEGPGSFGGDARRQFLGWLGGLAYRGPVEEIDAAPEPEESPEADGDAGPRAGGPARGPESGGRGKAAEPSSSRDAAAAGARGFEATAASRGFEAAAASRGFEPVASSRSLEAASEAVWSGSAAPARRPDAAPAAASVKAESTSRWDGSAARAAEAAGHGAQAEAFAPRSSSQAEPFVPRASSQAEPFAPRPSSQAEAFAPRASSQAEAFVPRAPDGPRASSHAEAFAPQPSSQAEPFAPRSLEVARAISPADGYATRADAAMAASQAEAAAPRASAQPDSGPARATVVGRATAPADDLLWRPPQRRLEQGSDVVLLTERIERPRAAPLSAADTAPDGSAGRDPSPWTREATSPGVGPAGGDASDADAGDIRRGGFGSGGT